MPWVDKLSGQGQTLGQTKDLWDILQPQLSISLRSLEKGGHLLQGIGEAEENETG